MTEVIDFLNANQSYVRKRVYDPNGPKVGGVYPKFLSEGQYSAVAKTLICVASRVPYCLVLGYERRADLKRLSKELSTTRFQLAQPDDVTCFTGFKVGSVSPIMPNRQIRTVFDTYLVKHSHLYVNAGEPGVQIRVQTESVLSLLNAQIATFSEPL